MIAIIPLVANDFQENTYIVYDELKQAIIIDCGLFYEQEIYNFRKIIHENSLTPIRLISTHGHIDHNIGNGIIKKDYNISPEPYIGDKDLMNCMDFQSQYLFGTKLKLSLPTVKHYLELNDIIKFGNHKFTLIHTPGHTHGSVCFYCKEEKTLFTGDTLFKESIGRTDLPGGDYKEIVNSLEILKMLPKDTKIFPGHGESSIIEHELKYNPFLK